MKTPLERRAHYDLDRVNYFYFTVLLLLKLYIGYDYLQKITLLLDNSQFYHRYQGNMDSNFMDLFIESHAVDYVVPKSVARFMRQKTLVLQFPVSKDALHRISDLIFE